MVGTSALLPLNIKRKPVASASGSQTPWFKSNSSCLVGPVLGACDMCDMTSQHISTPNKYYMYIVWCLWVRKYIIFSIIHTQRIFECKTIPKLWIKRWSVVYNLWVPASTIYPADKGNNFEPRVVGAGLLMNLCNLKHLKFIQKVQGRKKGATARLTMWSLLRIENRAWRWKGLGT